MAFSTRSASAKMQQNSHSVACDAWPPSQMELDARLRDSGVSLREIAALLGVNVGTVAACSKRLPRRASVVALFCESESTR